MDRLVCPFYKKKIVRLNKISNVSNCISGEFHNFTTKGNNFVCLRCNEIANPEKIIKVFKSSNNTTETYHVKCYYHNLYLQEKNKFKQIRL